ncbi:uncharacterized protein J3R85_014714 [Psidium guajava]|nr:uncharacterized protein J3R85_014714 [Psidium guajava]
MDEGTASYVVLVHTTELEIVQEGSRRQWFYPSYRLPLIIAAANSFRSSYASLRTVLDGAALEISPPMRSIGMKGGMCICLSERSSSYSCC